MSVVCVAGSHESVRHIDADRPLSLCDISHTPMPRNTMLHTNLLIYSRYTDSYLTTHSQPLFYGYYKGQPVLASTSS